MKTVGSFAMKAVGIIAFTAAGTSLSACAPGLALIPLGVGAAFIAFDGPPDGKSQASDAATERAQYSEASLARAESGVGPIQQVK